MKSIGKSDIVPEALGSGGLLIGLLGLLIAFGCSKNFSDNPVANQPPETHISVLVTGPLNFSTSLQTFNWWGDDPDGVVVGYLYTFDESAVAVTTWDSAAPPAGWTFTTARGATLTLLLTGADTVYVLRVAAIDDFGAVDPSPDEKAFPILNSRPTVEFPIGTDVPDTTFTVANFTWSGFDPDGDNNIDKYQYVLDDTTQTWLDLPAASSSITLTAADGLTEGEHVFYLRAVDIATAASPIIRMPRDEADTWYVREPTGSFLVIDDHNIGDNTLSTYRTILTDLIGSFDIWDIKRNGSELDPPSSDAFTQTILLFDRIFWFADTSPNLIKAQVAVPEFIEGGGKLIMSVLFQEFTSNLGDPLAFSPVDSLGPRINRLTRDQVLTTSPFAANLGLPDLKQSTVIIPNVFPLVPKISSNVLYSLPASANWTGTPAMALIDVDNAFVFFGLPIVGLDANNNVDVLLEKILLEIF